MALNWLEQLVADLYRLRDYLVHTNVDLLLRRGEQRAVGGHSDIDVLAANGQEVLHFECQTWWVAGPSEEKREFGRLIDRFEQGEEHLRKLWPFLFPDKDKTPYRRVFVVGGRPDKPTGKGPYDRLDAFAKQHGIEVRNLEDLVSEYLDELDRAFPSADKVGKEVGQAGLLLYLRKYGWLK